MEDLLGKDWIGLVYSSVNSLDSLESIGQVLRAQSRNSFLIAA